MKFKKIIILPLLFLSGCTMAPKNGLYIYLVTNTGYFYKSSFKIDGTSLFKKFPTLGNVKFEKNEDEYAWGLRMNATFYVKDESYDDYLIYYPLKDNYIAKFENDKYYKSISTYDVKEIIDYIYFNSEIVLDW